MRFARAFNITWPDSDQMAHGVQFPSGRCVLDDEHAGLYRVAVSIKSLLELISDGAVITWREDVENRQDGPVLEGSCSQRGVQGQL